MNRSSWIIVLVLLAIIIVAMVEMYIIGTMSCSCNTGVIKPEFYSELNKSVVVQLGTK